MGVAAQLAARARRRRGSTAPSATGQLPGVPILTQQFGQDLRLVVQIAWGANLAADPSTWLWTDVTSDVKYAQKVVNKLGRADESSTPQPGVITITVDNRSGNYSKGPQSANYPFVRKGTPLQVVVIYRDTTYTRAMGDIASFTPDWDTTGNYAVVHIEADGVKRRLNQGTEVLQSTLRRSIPGLPSLVSYWPCEDGSTTGSLTSAIPGGAPLAISGSGTQLASYSGYAGSLAIPTFATDSWSASIPAYPTVDSGQIRFLLNTPVAGMPDQTRIVRLTTSGTIAAVELRYSGTPSQGGLRMLSYDRTGSVLDDSGTVIFNVNGAQNRFSLSWSPSGLNMNLTMSTLTVGSSTGGFTTRAISSASLVSLSNVSFAPDATLTGCSIGHIYVQGLEDSLFTLAQQLSAFNGEASTTRLARLCTEQGEKITVYGGTNQMMGPQIPDTFINLLEACATVDQGYLFDCVSPGLVYFSRDTLENQSVELALRADIGQIEQPISPVDDDQLTVNEYTTNRPNGATVTYADTTGPLAVKTVGTYSGSATVNCQYDHALIDVASWRVHLGNLDEYRYPTLNLALHHHPELLLPWLDLIGVIAGRVEVTGLSTVRSQQAAETVRLFTEGWTETIDQFTWSIAMNNSHYEPWRVMTLAQDAGDTSSTLCRLDTDGSTTIGDTPAGATTVTVSTPSGPLWIEGSGDDFPFDINLGGWQVTVSSIADGLPNSTFETGLSPWTGVGGTAVQSTTHAHSGTHSAQMTPDGISPQDSIVSPLVPVNAGQQYTASGWVYFSSAVTTFSMSVSWYDVSSTLISTSSVLVAVVAGMWVKLTNWFTAPFNAAYASLVPTLSGSPANTLLWWLDDAQLSVPQVFTLSTPTPADVPPGSPVSVWLPTYLTM